MWQFYHANMSCHAMTLTFDPLTLKDCGRSGGTWSKCVLNLIEIEQLPAELFTIWQIFARFTSRCDLDLWPLDLELSWLFGRHVFKVCVKFEQNRTIRCRVIDDLAQYRREILEGVAFPGNGSQGCVDRTSPNLMRTYAHHVCSPSLFRSWDILLHF